MGGKGAIMWFLLKLLWKVIGALRYIMGPAILILAAVILYLFMESMVLKGGFIRFDP
jgi:hypothetical protein